MTIEDDKLLEALADKACAILWHDGDVDSDEWRYNRKALKRHFYTVLIKHRKLRPDS